MNRWLTVTLTAGLVAVFSGGSAFRGPAFGADKSVLKNERRLLLRHEEMSRKKLADKLRLERAQQIARARLAASGYGARPATRWVPFGYPTYGYPASMNPPVQRSFYW